MTHPPPPPPTLEGHFTLSLPLLPCHVIAKPEALAGWVLASLKSLAVDGQSYTVVIYKL